MASKHTEFRTDSSLLADTPFLKSSTSARSRHPRLAHWAEPLQGV